MAPRLEHCLLHGILRVYVRMQHRHRKAERGRHDRLDQCHERRLIEGRAVDACLGGDQSTFIRPQTRKKSRRGLLPDDRRFAFRRTYFWLFPRRGLGELRHERHTVRRREVRVPLGKARIHD